MRVSAVLLQCCQLSALSEHWYIFPKHFIGVFPSNISIFTSEEKEEGISTLPAAQQSLTDRSPKDSRVRNRKMRSALNFCLFLQLFKGFQLFKLDLAAACVGLWQPRLLSGEEAPGFTSLEKATSVFYHQRVPRDIH